jgi:hypothetical protein
VKKISAEEAKSSLKEHVREKAFLAREKYGTFFDLEVMRKIMADRQIVRYPMTLDFSDDKLQAGEFAFLEVSEIEESPVYCLHVHPRYRECSEALPKIIAYYVVVVNYGDIATHEEAEIFGATLLGISIEGYYQDLCRYADQLSK